MNAKLNSFQTIFGISVIVDEQDLTEAIVLSVLGGLAITNYCYIMI
jgi:hypothetical protein